MTYLLVVDWSVLCCVIPQTTYTNVDIAMGVIQDTWQEYRVTLPNHEAFLHPLAMTMHGACLYIKMPLCIRSLSDVMWASRHCLMGEEELMIITAKLVRAFRLLAAHGDPSKPIIVHRDVKPENILVARDADGKLVLKLVDFGLLAWYMGMSKEMEEMKERGEEVEKPLQGYAGTEGFVAPEVKEGRRYDCTADLFSVGRSMVTIAYALDGKKAPDVDPLKNMPISGKFSLASRLVLNGLLLTDPSKRNHDKAENLLIRCFNQLFEETYQPKEFWEMIDELPLPEEFVERVERPSPPRHVVGA